MAKDLISFPSAAMVVPDDEWEVVDRDAHAVIGEARAAGVYVFGGGIDESAGPAAPLEHAARFAGVGLVFSTSLTAAPNRRGPAAAPQRSGAQSRSVLYSRTSAEASEIRSKWMTPRSRPSAVSTSTRQRPGW